MHVQFSSYSTLNKHMNLWKVTCDHIDFISMSDLFKVCSNFLSFNFYRTSWLLPSIQLLPIASPLQWGMWVWFVNTEGFQGRIGWQEKEPWEQMQIQTQTQHHWPTTMTIGHARVGQIKQGKPISTVWASPTDFSSMGQVWQHRPNSTAQAKFDSPSWVWQHGPNSTAWPKFNSAGQVWQHGPSSTIVLPTPGQSLWW